MLYLPSLSSHLAIAHDSSKRTLAIVRPYSLHNVMNS
ncbi:hypothetical protein [Mediterraneibacter gnavus]